MATATITLFENKSSKQATDYSFGVSLADVSHEIYKAITHYARISKIELQFSCQASVSVGYANVDTYVAFASSDSNANSTSKSTRLISKSYKTTDGVQTDKVDITQYFQSESTFERQNTSYTRLSVYFDTTNITQKTFTCNYLKLVITYEKYRKLVIYPSPSDAGEVIGSGDYIEGTTAVLRAVPKEGYRFVKWWDGSTANPYNFVVSSDLSHTTADYCYFEVDKINKIYIGTSQPKEIYVGISKVKGIYIGTTKVYG